MRELISISTEVKHLNKQDLFNQGSEVAVQLLDRGFHDPHELLISARKAQEFLNGHIKTSTDATREKIDEYNGKIEAFGATIEVGSTGDRLDYDKDDTYKDLKRSLKEREDYI